MTARRCRLVLLTCILGATAGCSTLERTRGNWWDLSREPSGQAPDPVTTPEAVAQVYAALSHYHANQGEIDADLEAEKQEAAGLEREYQSSSQLL